MCDLRHQGLLFHLLPPCAPGRRFRAVYYPPRPRKGETRMTILARSSQQMESEPRRVRIQASEPLFFQAFAQGYGLAQQDYDGQPLTDDTLYGYIRRTMTQPDLSPRWKAGAITGWVAAVYPIPRTFEEQTTPPKPAAPAVIHY